MTDKTISDLTAVTLPLDGSELLEIERAGASYRIHSGDLAQTPPAAITVVSGAAPVDINPLATPYVEITSGGTGGVEIVNLTLPTRDPVQFGNAQYMGRICRVIFKVQTNPADAIHITVDGSTTVYIYEGQQQNWPGYRTNANGIVLDQLDMAAAFIWSFNSWYYSVLMSGGGNSTNYGTDTTYIQSASAVDTPGNQLVVRPGPVFSAGNHDGADLVLAAGQGSGTGANGTVLLGGGGVGPTLQTTDPGSPDKIWNNLGIVAFSGTPPLAPSTVAALPLAGTAGRRAMVNNALAPAFGAVVAGAGAVTVPVYDDGTNWRVG